MRFESRMDSNHLVCEQDFATANCHFNISGTHSGTSADRFLNTGFQVAQREKLAAGSELLRCNLPVGGLGHAGRFESIVLINLPNFSNAPGAHIAGQLFPGRRACFLQVTKMTYFPASFLWHWCTHFFKAAILAFSIRPAQYFVSIPPIVQRYQQKGGSQQERPIFPTSGAGK